MWLRLTLAFKVSAGTQAGWAGEGGGWVGVSSQSPAAAHFTYDGVKAQAQETLEWAPGGFSALIPLWTLSALPLT